MRDMVVRLMMCLWDSRTNGNPPVLREMLSMRKDPHCNDYLTHASDAISKSGSDVDMASPSTVIWSAAGFVASAVMDVRVIFEPVVN